MHALEAVKIGDNLPLRCVEDHELVDQHGEVATLEAEPVRW